MTIRRSATIWVVISLLLVLSAGCTPPLASPQPEHPAPPAESGGPSSGDPDEQSTWVSPGTNLSLTILHTADTWGYVLPCG